MDNVEQLCEDSLQSISRDGKLTNYVDVLDANQKAVTVDELLANLGEESKEGHNQLNMNDIVDLQRQTSY